MKHQCSNEYILILYSVTFPMLIWCSTQGIRFCLKFESSFGRKDTLLTMRGKQTLSQASQVIFIYLRELKIHPSSNGCMPLCHSVTFPRLIWCSKFVNLLQMFEFVLIKRPCIDHQGIRNAVKGSSDNVHIPKVEQEALKQQWMSIFLPQHHISWADLVPKIGIFLLEN